MLAIIRMQPFTTDLFSIKVLWGHSGSDNRLSCASPPRLRGARAKASVVPSYRQRGERLALEASSHLSRSCVCLWRALSPPLTWTS
ncbi:hypothetical protein TNCV_2423111 [Trichonephila clavipes]|nr:hypothetical protein TNCV_2423111 [Trichonephila clavipes]